LRRLILAITFLTRFPLPVPKDVTAEEIGRSTPFFPLVGLLLGLILVGIDRLSSYLWPPLIVDAVIFASLVVMTGGLHIDGLMDTCDGIFSGRERDRMLEIMRDSRVGAFGVIGAICVSILKIASLNAIHGPQRWSALILFPMLGRWSMVWSVSLFPYARATSGLGRPFTEAARKHYVIWAGFPVLVVAIPMFLWRSVWIIAVTGIVAWLIGKWLYRRIGGLTGDNYGAICEITETLSLMMICVG